ncbi:MAG: hypothetical protein K940chlam6_01029 [Chlamydiae bacterium]|nr:hypothetical protein [Chlamydiota bacterium]
MNISNPIVSSIRYVISGPCRKEPYLCGVEDTLYTLCGCGAFVGTIVLLNCYFRIEMYLEMLRDQQFQEKQHPSPFIMALEDRIINHTQDLSDENPIKSLAQKYLYALRVQHWKDRVYSWIPFVGR